jgi:hypothetical protein
MTDSTSCSASSVVMIPQTGLFTCGTTSWSFSSSSKVEILRNENLSEPGSVATNTGRSALICRSLGSIVLTKTIKDRSDPLFVALRLMPEHTCLGMKFQCNARFVEIYFGDRNASSEMSELRYLTTSKASPLPATGSSSLYRHEYDLPSSVPPQSSIHFKLLSMKQVDPEVAVQCRIEDFLLILSTVAGSTLPSSTDSQSSPKQAERSQGQPVTATATAGAVAGPMLTLSEEERQKLQEAKNQLQQMKSQLQGTHRAMASTTGMGPLPQSPMPTHSASQAAGAGAQGNAMIGLIASMALPNSPLQSVITQVQRSMLSEFSKLLDEKMLPVLQRLDRLEQQLQKVSVLTETTAKTVVTATTTTAATAITSSPMDMIEKEESVEESSQAAELAIVTAEPTSIDKDLDSIAEESRIDATDHTFDEPSDEVLKPSIVDQDHSSQGDMGKDANSSDMPVDSVSQL